MRVLLTVRSALRLSEVALRARSWWIAATVRRRLDLLGRQIVGCSAMRVRVRAVCLQIVGHLRTGVRGCRMTLRKAHVRAVAVRVRISRSLAGVHRSVWLWGASGAVPRRFVS